MTIDKEILHDLISLEDAGLASESTRKLIAQYRAEHPEWLQPHAEPLALPPVSAPDRVEAEALARTQRLIQRRNWLLGFAAGLTGTPFAVAFTRTIDFVMYRDAPAVAAVLYAAALALWAGYVATGRRLRTLGIGSKSAPVWVWALTGHLVSAPLAVMVAFWTGQTVAANAVLVTGAVAGILAQRFTR